MCECLHESIVAVNTAAICTSDINAQLPKQMRKSPPHVKTKIEEKYRKVKKSGVEEMEE